MKYLRENFDEFVNDEKMMEYFRSLIGRYIVFYYVDALYLGKISEVYCIGEDYLVKGMEYFRDARYDSFENAYMKLILIISRMLGMLMRC